MTRRIFTYGTLGWTEVVETLLGRRPPRRPAVLDHYTRSRVSGEPYPALAARRGARTEGVVYEHLEATELALLDRFEGSLYERRVVSVRTAREHLTAETYVLCAAHEHRLSGLPWDREHFARRHLRATVAACRALRRSASEALG